MNETLMEICAQCGRETPIHRMTTRRLSRWVDAWDPVKGHYQREWRSSERVCFECDEQPRARL